ncbi:hypothetical protein LWI29_020268 [Acer saccharum]|uniref:Uncharacterized protein n=1 Tax=Acer saccharum TaxID=4024 RepID=A0AA39W380_ACESA|nr:hypothetical protein LWI29_020268 [Acer saccharum]KAK1547894.1 hypothetical protein Q3G72_017788 [Acer saccharum]
MHGDILRLVSCACEAMHLLTSWYEAFYFSCASFEAMHHSVKMHRPYGNGYLITLCISFPFHTSILLLYGVSMCVFSQLENIAKSSATSAVAWVGESGGAYNSGHHLVTDAFVYSFW